MRAWSPPTGSIAHSTNDSAALCAAVEESRCVDPWHLYRRLRGGIDGSAWRPPAGCRTRPSPGSRTSGRAGFVASFVIRQNEVEITIGWCQVDGVGDDLAELISISRSRAEPASRVERGRLIQAHRRGDHCQIIGRFPGLNKGPLNALRRISQVERGC